MLSEPGLAFDLGKAAWEIWVWRTCHLELLTKTSNYIPWLVCCYETLIVYNCKCLQEINNFNCLCVHKLSCFYHHLARPCLHDAIWQSPSYVPSSWPMRISLKQWLYVWQQQKHLASASSEPTSAKTFKPILTASFSLTGGGKGCRARDDYSLGRFCEDSAWNLWQDSTFCYHYVCSRIL